MSYFNRISKYALLRLVNLLIIVSLCSNYIVLPSTNTYAQSVLSLPPTGTMVPLSPVYYPAVVKGIKIFPNNPLRFDFIIDTGDSQLKDVALNQESAKLIKYFLASLTVPEENLWVNLSPYEKDRIITEDFSKTEMGRDMLAQDYLLKQITASLMFPEEEIGQRFWNKVYQKANDLLGTSEIPVNTFNKVWILPEKAVIYQKGETVLVAESHLKVMLEEDYLALKHNSLNENIGTNQLNTNDVEEINEVSSSVVRDIIIPELEKEVNEGENFAPLRQIYNSMILATWFKRNLKRSLLGQIYFNQAKTEGIEIEDRNVKEKIYSQYLEAFKKGVYDYIKEDYDEATQEVIPRKYFSGGIIGFDPSVALDNTENLALVDRSRGEVVVQSVNLVPHRTVANPYIAANIPADLDENRGGSKANIVNYPQAQGHDFKARFVPMPTDSPGMIESIRQLAHIGWKAEYGTFLDENEKVVYYDPIFDTTLRQFKGRLEQRELMKIKFWNEFAKRKGIKSEDLQIWNEMNAQNFVEAQAEDERINKLLEETYPIKPIYVEYERQGGKLPTDEEIRMRFPGFNRSERSINLAAGGGSLPKYGDDNFWPGRMKVADVELYNLGITTPADVPVRGGGRGFFATAPRPAQLSTFRRVYSRFRKAPTETVDILAKRFSNPSRQHGDILSKQGFVDALIGSMTNKEDIEELSKYIEQFSSERESFYEQLRIMRYRNDPKYIEKHRKLGVTVRHGNPPFHDATRAIISLGRMISLIYFIEKKLPENAPDIINRWKKDLQSLLSREEIRFFLSQTNFLNVIAEHPNPYLFVVKDGAESETPSGRISDDEQDEVDNLDDYSPYDDVGNERRMQMRIAKQIDIDPELKAAALQEFSNLIEQFGDLWVINVEMTDKQKLKHEGRDTHGGPAKYSFLRQFPDGVMKKTLSNIDYYSRLASMVLEDSFKFPKITKPDGSIQVVGTVKLGAYVNPLLTKEPETRRRRSSLGLFDLEGLEDLFRQREPEPEPEEPTSGIESLDIQLSPENSALLLSGPNMGGKTTTARGIAMAVLATQAGLPLPADDPEMAVFKNVYSLFPKPEQLQAGYGYFGSLMKELTELANKVGAGDLVILDEVPIGTDYLELVAVTAVILEDLIKTGATIVVTGHLKKAFELVAERTGQQPFMHTITEKDGQIVPNFKLEPGVAKHSYAIELMTRAGFPKEIQDLARQYYGVITEGEDPREIGFSTPTDEIEERRTRQTKKIEIAKKDQEAIKAVLRDLYPEDNFVLKDTLKALLKTFVDVEDFGDQMGIAARRLRGEPEEEKQFQMEDIDQRTQEAQRRLYLTTLFVNQEKAFLSTLRRLLHNVQGRLEERDFGFRFKPYDPEEQMRKIDALAHDVEEIILHLNPLKEDREMKSIIEEINGNLESLRELHKENKELDISGMDENAQKEKTDRLNGEWQSLRKEVARNLTSLDMYAGITNSIKRFGLRSPQFTDSSNVFTLNDSKPFSPSWSRDPFIENAVAQSFSMDPNKPVMVLTGPNSSGKSVLMFNSWLNALFAMRGFYVSGDLEMSNFDNVFLFMGGRDNVAQGESYFLDILKKYAEIIENVTPNSLVVLDELHGTDNFELAAIQLAVLRYLRSMNVSVIFNTHIRDGLKELADEVGLDLWKTDVVFDQKENNINPLFTVSRDPNLEAKSYGLIVAKQWLTQDQQKRAEQIYNDLFGEDSNGDRRPDDDGGDGSSPVTNPTSVDNAQLAESDVGGIDFNPNNLDLQTQGQDIDFNFTFDSYNLQSAPINGFTPVIFQTVPINSLPLYLGEVDEKENFDRDRLENMYEVSSLN